MFRIYRVRGNSMQPTMNEGDYVVAFNRFVSKLFKPRVGKLVVVNHPEHGVMVKRIESVASSTIRLCGDNVKESLCPDAMGELAIANIIGRIFYIVRKGRARKK